MQVVGYFVIPRWLVVHPFLAGKLLCRVVCFLIDLEMQMLLMLRYFVMSECRLQEYYHYGETDRGYLPCLRAGRGLFVLVLFLCLLRVYRHPV